MKKYKNSSTNSILNWFKDPHAIGVLVLIGISLIFFYKYFLQGLLPIPADIITGLYFPWLDYKWDNTVGVAVKNPLMSDIPSLIYPWRTLAIELFKNGEWPLWNQYSFSGYPLLGNFQSAPFSLTNIWYLFFTDAHAWSIGVMIQPLLACLMMYFFLRHKTLSVIPSILGSFLFGFSGFNLTWMWYNTHAWSMMWLPVMLIAVDKVMEGNYKWSLLLAFVFAVSVLGGYPIILVYELMVIGIYALTSLWKVSRISHFSLSKSDGLLKEKVVKKAGDALFIFLGAGVLGLGLSAIQWIPGLEMIEKSIHAMDTSTLAEANQGYVPLQHFINLLAPDFFGNPATYNYWGIGYYDNLSFYISIGGLLLSLLAFIWSAKSRIWLGVTIAGLVLATDNIVGKFIFNSIPVLKNSIAARGLFLVDLGFAVGAAYGLEWLKTIGDNGKVKQLVVFIIMGLGFGILWWNVKMQNWLEIPEMAAHMQIATRNLVLPSLFFGSLSCLLFLGWFIPRKWSSLVLQFLFLLLVVFDLFRYGWKYLPFSPEKYLYPTTEVTQWLQEKRSEEGPFRVEFGEAIPANMWIPLRLESPTGYDALFPLRYGKFLELMQTGKAGTSTSRFPSVWKLESQLFDLTNTRYVLAIKYTDKLERSTEGKFIKEMYQLPKFKKVYEFGTVQILENTQYFPRAFIVHQVVVANSDEELTNMLADSKVNLREVVYLEKANLSNQISRDDLKEVSANERDAETDSLVWLHNTGNKREIKLKAVADGYLVISENYDEGWEAMVNNAEVKPERANYAYMAIPVKKGENSIKLDYSPKSFRIGLIISCISCLALMLLTALLFKIRLRK